MKEISVLGVNIKDYPLKELLKLSTEYLAGPGVHTMSWLSANVLLSVSENAEEQRPWVDDLDLMICDQAGILKRGRAASELHRDGKSEDFMENFFKYLGTNGASITLICDSIDDIEHLHKKLRGYSDRLNIISRYVYEGIDYMDDLFNQINGDFPKIVITLLPWTSQGPLLDMARQMSSASLWICMLPEMLVPGNAPIHKKNEAFLDRFMFGRRVATYEKNDEKK